MNSIARLLLRFARWVAGTARADWINAMEAETSTLGREDKEWAFGCAAAAVRDRCWRERMSLLLMVLAPIGAALFCLLLFFPMSRLFLAGWLPSWASNVVMLVAPMPFAWMLGRFCRSAPLVIASLSFAIFAMIPGLIFWIEFGRSALIFLAPDTQWYGMSAYVGLASSLLIWLIGASLGVRWQRANT